MSEERTREEVQKHVRTDITLLKVPKNRFWGNFLGEVRIHTCIIVNPEGSMIHQYYKKSLKNAIQFTIEMPLWRATLIVQEQ